MRLSSHHKNSSPAFYAGLFLFGNNLDRFIFYGIINNNIAININKMSINYEE